VKKSLFALSTALALGSAALAQPPADPASDGAGNQADVDTIVDAGAKEPAERLPERRQSLRRDWQPSLTAPPSSPELWLYEQERQRYEDPKAAVRRAAEYRATQRQRRIESRKWFGYSNSRPIASPNPWYDTYSPMWVGNSFFPYEWAGVGPSVAVRPGWYGTSY